MELSVMNLKKYLLELENRTSISTTYQATTFGPSDMELESRHGDDKPHPECMMTASVENLNMLSAQINKQKRRYQRRHSYESDSDGVSESGASSAHDFSDSESLSPGGDDDLEGTWFSGDEGEDTPMEYGLIDSEIIELGGDKIVWETHFVALERKPGIGFGIAVSGGVDNPHFASGETSIAISDVLKGGPAEGKLKVKDRVLSINGTDMDDILHSSAIQLLQASPDVVELVIKRRVYLPSPHSRLQKSVVISRPQTKKNKDLGFELGCKFYIKKTLNNNPEIARSTTSLTPPDEQMEEGDFILKINDKDTESLTLSQVQKIMEKTKGKLQLTLERPPKPIPSRPNSSIFGSMDSLALRVPTESSCSPASSPESGKRLRMNLDYNRRPRSSTFTGDMTMTSTYEHSPQVRRARANTHTGDVRTSLQTEDILVRSRANSHTDGIALSPSATVIDEAPVRTANRLSPSARRARANTYSGDVVTETCRAGEDKRTKAQRAQDRSSLENLSSNPKSLRSSRTSLAAGGQLQTRLYHKKPGRTQSFSNQSCQSSPAYLHRRMRKENAERVRKHSTSLQYINRAFVEDDEVGNFRKPTRGHRLPLFAITQH